VVPAQPLYDVLPPAKKAEADRKAIVGSPIRDSELRSAELFPPSE